MLPLLTSVSVEHPSFHVVVPSLPGFGFSQYTTKTGFGLEQYAEARHHNVHVACSFAETSA